MGMFDSFYDAAGSEWQTKAYDCELKRYRAGDRMPPVLGSYYGNGDASPQDYQVEVCGGPGDACEDSLATVRARHLEAINAPRDEGLVLVDYYGHIRTDA